MQKIYLVRYIADNEIDGFVYKEEDFKKYLKELNRDRRRDGETPFNASEFDLLPCYELKNVGNYTN